MNNIQLIQKNAGLLEWISNKTQLEAPFKYRHIDQLKAKGWKNMDTTTNKRKAGMSILILDQMNFRKRNITGSKKWNLMIIKGSICMKRS